MTKLVVIVTHVVPACLGKIIAQHFIGPEHSEARELEEDRGGSSLQDLFVREREGVSGVNTVLRAVTAHIQLLILDFIHNLLEADIAQNKASTVAVPARDMPGLTPTDFGSLAPGTLQLTICLRVEIK